MIEARYYEKQDSQGVRCRLCPHQCVIEPMKRGICGVRENHKGVLMSLNYGRAIAIHIDPIEKKPLFHVLPGSQSLSIATVGCNLKCAHCQNHDISQYPRRRGQIPGNDAAPEAILQEAREVGAQTISFTYSEPTIFWEWAQDIAALAVPAGIRCVSVTNGYTAAQPIRDVQGKLLAANVDLKSFREDFYRHTCGAQLQPVLDTIRLMHALGIWVEITTLLIPDLNDSATELTGIAAFIASVDPSIPWHLSRFHPDNEMLDHQATPITVINRARKIGHEAGLRFVYSGNVWGDEGEHTRCPACNATLIERYGFSVKTNRIRDGRCPDCSETIQGIWT